MPMPEAPMDEKDRPVLWKHNVRTSGQFLSMQAETQATRVKSPSQNQFGFCMPSANPRHIVATLLF